MEVPILFAAVHVKAVPAMLEFNATDVCNPLHIVELDAEPVGFGFTVTATVNVEPAHPVAVGVTI